MSAKSLGLEGTFRDANPSGSSGVVMNIRAKEGVGKTYLALRYAPEPVAYLNGDRDNSRLVKMLREKYHRKIICSDRYVYDLPGDKIRERNEAMLEANILAVRPVLKRFEQEFHSALKSECRSVVVDQSKWLWETIRLGWFGKLAEIAQVLYSQVNARMMKLLHAAEKSGKCVIFISRAGEVWKDRIEMTPQGPKKVRRPVDGLMESQGFKEFDFEMQVIVDLYYTDKGLRVAKITKGVKGIGMKWKGKKIALAPIIAVGTRTKEEQWR